MCGLAGIVHWNKDPLLLEDLNRMIFQLEHRGPDELRAVSLKEWAGFAHARLRVIDLSDAARQPMMNEDGSVWLLYNGEIYNFQELRKELHSKGVSFRSQSDTEVVLRAYDFWGVEAIQRFDGMFAFAIWDDRRQELILARDPAGKKPLFYWTDGDCVAFGSEIKALFTHKHVPQEINESVFPFLITYGYPPTGQTCYRQIRQVPPATFLRFRSGEREPIAQLYWKLRFDSSHSSLKEQEEGHTVRPLLTEAVRRRLYSDVPLGAFLSGGIDSTIVVGLMRKLLPNQPIKTFSIGFEGDQRFDETAYAQIVAEKFQTDHMVFKIAPQPFDLVERIVWHYDQPFGDSSALPTYLLSQQTREHVTVALSGDGGDEIFGGYDRFLAALWAEKIPRPILRCAQAILKNIPARNERTWITRVKRFTIAAQEPLLKRYLRWISYVEDPSIWLKNIPLEDDQDRGLSYRMTATWERSHGWSPLSRLLALNFDEYLPNDLLVKADRCSMAHGLEVRSPFLDRALLEYAAALPDRCKLSGITSKVLLKNTFRDLLPVSIQHRSKMGFGVPLGTWLRGQWREPLQDYLGAAQPRIARYVDHQRIQKLMREHLQGLRDAGHTLWLFLTFEIWLRQLEASS